ncbi:unnamed protein product [Rotaria sp. Silwood1]|nr:unnamed protein product [Rotaria sp. Silwood1]
MNYDGAYSTVMVHVAIFAAHSLDIFATSNSCKIADYSDLCVLNRLNQYECLSAFNTKIQNDSRAGSENINLVEHESALQCHCVRGECVYHVDEDSGHR